MVRFSRAAATAPIAASVKVMTVDPRLDARVARPSLEPATTDSATSSQYTGGPLGGDPFRYPKRDWQEPATSPADGPVGRPRSGRSQLPAAGHGAWRASLGAVRFT